MNRIRNFRIVIFLATLVLALLTMAGWIMRQHGVNPWVDSGDFVIGAGMGIWIGLMFLAIRMKNRPAC